MQTLILILIILVVLAALYLFLLAPNRDRRSMMRPFEETLIAHRGLFDNRSDAPENSLPAFSRAVEAGYGIELDVQMTTDGRLVVFHDDTLARMCSAEKNVTDCSYDELQQYTLAESSEHIPLFDEVLRVIGGKVPLIVEIKSAGDYITTTRLMAERMDSYDGLYCMESFHPLAVHWFRKNRPDILRGQLSTDYFKDNVKRSTIQKFCLTNLLLNFLSRPDFIAYNHLYAGQFSYRVCRRLFPVSNVAWTIRSQAELENARRVFTTIIFDSFIPLSDEPGSSEV